jgi:hypothetical protein
MRFEFEGDARVVASVLWEGPGQAVVETDDRELRAEFDRFFASEVTYLGGVGGGPSDEADLASDVLQSRRRDWNPWEFERACRTLAYRHGWAVRRVETGPVEDRSQEVGTR